MANNTQVNGYFTHGGVHAKGAESKLYPSLLDNDGDVVYIMPMLAESINDIVSLAENDKDLMSFLRLEMCHGNGLMFLNGRIFWATDIIDQL
jgi:hypothetical protein